MIAVWKRTSSLLLTFLLLVATIPGTVASQGASGDRPPIKIVNLDPEWEISVEAYPPFADARVCGFLFLPSEFSLKAS